MGNISHTTGNVGIGTTTPLVPLVPLDVRGGSIRVNSSGSFEQSVAFSAGVGGWARGLFFVDGTASGTFTGLTGGIGMLGNGTSPSSIFIGHGDTPWAGTNSIYLLTNGNVGVGTSSPTTKLDVNGGVKAASLALTGKATSASTVSADGGTTLVTKDFLPIISGITYAANGNHTGENGSVQIGAIIIKWGYVNNANETFTVTFGSPFPNACNAVVYTSASGSAGTNNWSAYSYTKNGFTVRGQTNEKPGAYIAIGY